MSPATTTSRRKDATEEVRAHGKDLEDAIDQAVRDIVHAVLERAIILKRTARNRVSQLESALRGGTS